MSEIVTGNVTKVSMSEPRQGKFGEFINVGLQVNGEYYNKAVKGSSKSEAGKQLMVFVGDKVELTVDPEKRSILKDGIKVLVKNATEAKAHTSAKPKATAPATAREDSFKENALGAQVGNALNIAAELLGQGATVAKLKKTALEVLHVSEELKAALRSGLKQTEDPEAEEEPEDWA